MVVHKTTLGALSVGITVVAYAVYIWQTARKGNIQPHPFSWLLWGLVTAVVFLIQWARGAGPGSWVTGFTAAVCFIIGGLTLIKYTWHFSWFDWSSLAMGLVVFLFYLLAKNATQSAVLATVIDVLGYGSTIKKGWAQPYTDSASSFALNSLKFIPALFALESYSVATWLYPLTLIIVNGAVAIMLLVRRWHIG